MAAPRIFSVPLGLPFLREAVRSLKQNRLIEGADMRDPASLAALQIYVPSKRVARALRSVMAEEAENHAALLPSILPLGEMEDSDFLRFNAFFQQNAENAAEAAAQLKRPALIGSLERQLLLARLIRPWREKLPAHIRALFGRETIEIPANTADALWLARHLAALMDEIETEGADAARLGALAPAELAEWWQVTVEFLHLVFAVWPQILAERDETTAAARRNQILRAEAALRERACHNGAALFGRQGQPHKPVLMLGSAGSFPAVAEFIKTIAHAPQGAVVLPPLDRDLEQETWDALDKDPLSPAAFTHPQYALKRLLQKLNLRRDAVVFLGGANKTARTREKCVSEIFRPSESTEFWAKLREPRRAAGAAAAEPDKFAHISLIEAPAMREEALALAIALRAALEQPGKTAALITGDRQLARRVCAELARFGIKANDSGGAPLAETEPATALRLLLDAVFNPGNAVAVLALLKHPLTRLGMKRADLRRQTEQFEFFALRGGTGRINIGAAEDFMEERLEKLTQAERINSAFTAERLEEAGRLASLLTAAAAPLYRFAAGRRETDLAQAVIATVETLENFGRDEERCLKRLYAQEQGQKLIEFFRAALADRSGLTFMPQEWPKILEALMADETVEMRQNGHPRLFILGLFEARLQNFDTALIGGLNEGSLPHNPKNSPFMSRQMKAALGLPPPEQKIGFTAQDIAQILGMDNVILTRALRVDNAPSIASRWLQRLETVAGAQEGAAMRARGAYYLNAAQNLDNAPPLPFAARPCPKPPLAWRPQHFSITEIETLRRDPYAIYAKRILRLKPLEPLIRDAGITERGTLIHAVLAAFGQYCGAANIAPIKAAARQKLEQIAAEEFAKWQLPADIAVLWQPRLNALIPNYIEWEANLSQRRRFAEISAANTPIGETGCFLRGRADRIDIVAASGSNRERRAEIMDFKTGSSPDKKYARLLAAPQLALEAALLARGSFAECGSALAEALLYVRLKANGETAPEDIAAVKGKNAEPTTAQNLAEEAWRQLERLICHFGKPQTGYPSHALPPLRQSEGDYDHLARVFEWQAGAAAKSEEKS